MDWINLAIAVLAFLPAVIAARKLLQVEQQTSQLANRIREDRAKLVELRYLEALGFELDAAPTLTENFVESSTTMVQEIHREITRIPFGIMKSLPLMRQPTEVVKQTHDLVSDVVFESIRDVNKVAGKAGRDALQTRRKQWQKLIDDRYEDD